MSTVIPFDLDNQKGVNLSSCWGKHAVNIMPEKT
jgi:hypothetical protein